MNSRSGLILLGLFAMVFLACVACVLLFRGSNPVAAVWPANALILAVILRAFPDWNGRASGLAVSFGAMVLASLVCGRAILITYGFATANIVEIALAAWLLGGLRSPVSDLKALGIFFAAGVIGAPLASAAIAGGALALAYGAHEAWPSAVRWFAADALGIAIWGPLALTIGRNHRKTAGWPLRCVATAAVLLAGLTLTFFAPTAPLFLAFPLLIFAVYMLRDLGAVSGVALTALFAAAATMSGHGPFVAAGRLGWDPLMAMQAVLVTAVMTVMPITVLLERLDRYAAELDQRRVKAEEASEVKTRLLAHVSHEIRSPLSGVVGLAQLMESGAVGELTGPQREVLQRIGESGAEIEELSRDLLDAASIQAGKTTIHIAPLALDEAIEAAVTAARFRTRAYAPTIVAADGLGRGLFVAADVQRFRQIMVNLLTNAAKYGGRPPVIRIGVRALGDRIRVEVGDNGSGVPRDKRDQLFRAFNRLGAERTEIEGTGLGLALSRDLAQLQDGEIGVGDSDLGGALFWLDLPRAARAQAAA